MAYTVEPAAGAPERPVSFLFNGGPGAPSTLLLLGSIGPVRVETADAAPTPPAPYRLQDNPHSLLDVTDLVFIDAVETGYSRLLEPESAESFLGVDEDAQAFAQFIDRYLGDHGRWNAPRYLIGESYGAIRAAALLNLFQKRSVAFNGVSLVLPVLNYGERILATDAWYAGLVPSFAATAWYHGRIDRAAHPDVVALVQRARGFAFGRYLKALVQGHALPAAEKAAVAAELAARTGLDAGYVERAHLRIHQQRFRKELLRAQGEVVGWFDGRFKGDDVDPSADLPSYAPESAATASAYHSAFLGYAAGTLGWQAEESYLHRARIPFYQEGWNWRHAVPAASGAPAFLPVGNVLPDLAQVLRENEHLRLHVALGYYDLGTPLAATEHDLRHLLLPERLQRNVALTYYTAGHMVYLNDENAAQFAADLRERLYVEGYMPDAATVRPQWLGT
ncbi:S10 family peptidase [Xylophilus sp.]|uniref:S10 family peptidase n=1 Tax=Xylophilus sp. TaxID=2653893 RepID=UPI002D803B0E|nr:peptidase S10 [Xylophilus sp.]